MKNRWPRKKLALTMRELYTDGTLLEENEKDRDDFNFGDRASARHPGSVIVVLLERGELQQYDSSLAYKSADGKRAVKVTLPWLQAHLRERFQFTERGGRRVDPPAWLAKFLMKNWNRFPDLQYDMVLKPRKHRRRSGPI